MKRLIPNLIFVHTLCLLSPGTGAAAMPSEHPADTTHILREVVVRVSGRVKTTTDTLASGTQRLKIANAPFTPYALGEKDIIQWVSLMPGVQPEDNGTTGFQVRGGTSSQNVVLYANTPVYNIGHAVGLFSVFNDEALSDLTLYKGSQPATYGGASSAVLDITPRSAAKDSIHGHLNLGLLSSKLGLGLPLAHHQASLLLNARCSYADLLIKPIPKYRGNGFNFYDLNANLDWQLSPHNTLTGNIFVGHDQITLEDIATSDKNNLAGSLEWTHKRTSKLYYQSSLHYTHYTTRNAMEMLGYNVTLQAFIRRYAFRQSVVLPLTPRGSLQMGAQTALFDVQTAEWQKITLHEEERRKAWENAAWAHLNLSLSRWWNLSAGIRYTLFSNLGGAAYYDLDDTGDIIRIFRYQRGEIIHTRRSWEPRVELRYHPTTHLNVTVGVHRSTQDLHALKNQGTMNFFERYALSSNIVPTESMLQTSAGLHINNTTQPWSLSLEGYYRTLHNVPDYRDGIDYSSAIEVERLLLYGRGRSYGAECSAHATCGPLTTRLNYTLSWSQMQIDGINDGRWYNAPNDRRHNANITADCRLTSLWSAQLTWVYSTGRAFTAPSAKYKIIDNWVYYYAERNGYRTPANHHLDLGVTRRQNLRRRGTVSQWNFSIYNVYNRYNPILIHFEDESNGSRTKATKYSLFGIVPSVAYSYYF